MHWNGVEWGNIGILYSGSSVIGNVMYFWGTSNANLWGGRLGGSLVHYNGSNWQKIESGTTQDIQDIWGMLDEHKQEKKTLCTASNKYHGGEAFEDSSRSFYQRIGVKCKPIRLEDTMNLTPA